jgi:hypothetical protein
LLPDTEPANVLSLSDLKNGELSTSDPENTIQKNNVLESVWSMENNAFDLNFPMRSDETDAKDTAASTLKSVNRTKGNILGTLIPKISESVESNSSKIDSDEHSEMPTTEESTSQRDTTLINYLGKVSKIRFDKNAQSSKDKSRTSIKWNLTKGNKTAKLTTDDKVERTEIANDDPYQTSAIFTEQLNTNVPGKSSKQLPWSKFDTSAGQQELYPPFEKEHALFDTLESNQTEEKFTVSEVELNNPQKNQKTIDVSSEKVSNSLNLNQDDEPSIKIDGKKEQIAAKSLYERLEISYGDKKQNPDFDDPKDKN